MTQRQMDFTNLVIVTQAMDMQRQSLVMDFVYRRINMDEYNKRYNEIDRSVDAVHFRYIAKYRIVEPVADPKRATLNEVLNANRTN